MRLVRGAVAVLVVASACATFSEVKDDDAGAPAVDASAPLRFCAKTVVSSLGGCVDFDDDLLPAPTSGWQTKAPVAGHTTKIVAGGADGTPFALDLMGSRATNGPSGGAAIFRTLPSGTKPSKLTTTFAVNKDFVTGSTNDGSQNWDLFVVHGASSDKLDSMQLEIRPDGTINFIEFLFAEPDAAVIGGAKQIKVIEATSLPAHTWVQVKLTLTIGSGTSAVHLEFGGETVDHQATFDQVTALTDVTWGDSAVSQGVGYHVLLDDITFDLSP